MLFVKLPQCGAFVVMLIAAAWMASPSQAVVARFHFTIDGDDFGSVNVRLYDGAMPNSVNNFTNYADDDDWTGSFIHRSARTTVFNEQGQPVSVPFVVQGGGFKVPVTGLINNGMLDIDSVPTDPPIADEPGGGVAGISNQRGTIAMAKSGPNTATNQWFFNLRDNSTLDDPNRADGGFSAFGRVLGNGMNVIDAIAALPRINVGASPVQEVPVSSIATIQAQQDVFNKDVVIVQDVSIIDAAPGDYNFDGVVNSADYNLWKGSFGSTTNAAADGDGDGVVDAADYVVWRDSRGMTGASLASGTGGSGQSTAVPEPAGPLLILIGLALSRGCRLHSIRRRTSPHVHGTATAQ